jgi:hypothetical protein
MVAVVFVVVSGVYFVDLMQNAQGEVFLAADFFFVVVALFLFLRTSLPYTILLAVQSRALDFSLRT